MFSKLSIITIQILLVCSFQAIADSATQTDWSCGSGVTGPVTDWGNEFYTDTDIECYLSPSNILLRKTIALIPLEHTVDGDFNGAHSVYASDVNGDGYTDVLGAGYLCNDITWWENLDGLGTSWTEHTVCGYFAATRTVYSADINGDGYMDVLGAALAANDITWWENVDGSGTIWTEHIVDGDFGGAISVYSADINGDGYMDVLGAALAANDITWWENVDGSGTIWTEHTVEGDFDSAMSVHCADVNGDGFMDVLGASGGADDITWWENVDGSGTSWTEHIVNGDFDGAMSVYSADVNGDGNMDVLGAAATASDITWWENVDGSGTSWTEHTVNGDFDGAISVYSADVNADGFMDVLGAANTDDDITWWENIDGSGATWTEHIVDGDFAGSRSVHSADVNGDGYMDVLGAAVTADDITWWDLSEYLPDGSLESTVLDVQESPDWQTIDWTSTELAGTSVALQVRASANSSSMGAWSDTLTAPCTLEGILSDEDNYFQYRVILNSTDSLLSPVFHDVTVDWQLFTGTEEESEIEISTFALYGASPNPVVGTAVLGFSLPADSRVELTVFDLTGRTVHALSEEFCSGIHEVPVNDLACGVYLVRLTSGELTETRHFVVIE